MLKISIIPLEDAPSETFDGCSIVEVVKQIIDWVAIIRGDDEDGITDCLAAIIPAIGELVKSLNDGEFSCTYRHYDFCGGSFDMVLTTGDAN